MMTVQAVNDAMEAMREIFPETPLQFNEHLSRKMNANIFLKREDLSPVRSYKIRGAFNFLRKAIVEGGRERTFVCASAGNHAQGFAFVCRHFQVKGVVFMPVTTPQQKIDKTRILGGSLSLFGLSAIFSINAMQKRAPLLSKLGVPWCPRSITPILLKGKRLLLRKLRSKCPLAPCLI